MIDDFIKRKQGGKKVVYDLPELKEILAETLGVIVYQEQVQQIANKLASYSLGEGDILRRAMGKKKKKLRIHIQPLCNMETGFDNNNTKICKNNTLKMHS